MNQFTKIVVYSIMAIPAVTSGRILVPSSAPSDSPSMVPSDMPSMVPSDMPSMVPSDAPSMVPTEVPTKSPTLGSDYPSIVPTGWGTPGPTFPEEVWADPETRLLSQKISRERERNGLKGRARMR